jgi:hypothetical protein
MANPITECDRVRSYAAPDPPIRAAAAAGGLLADRTRERLVCAPALVRLPGAVPLLPRDAQEHGQPGRNAHVGIPQQAGSVAIAG